MIVQKLYISDCVEGWVPDRTSGLSQE